MTYYEELGISADAAEEDIRQAHRRLVKLLHPDQHPNEDLRRMAELQLIRVNSLVEQLLDPTQRKLYDLAVRTPIPPAYVPHARDSVPNETIHKWWKYAVSSVAIAIIAWVLTSGSPTDVVRSVTSGQASPLPGTKLSASSPASTKSTADRPRNAAGQVRQIVPAGSVPTAATVPDRPGATAPDPNPSESPGTSRSVVSASPEPVQQPTPPAKPPEAKSSATLSGVWLYAGGKRSSEDDRLYKPEYIELRIQEEGGILHGEYRSRYAVTDLPISPAVNFSFQGSLAGPAAALPWKGPKGSAGTVVLKMLNKNAMQVDWKMTDAGDSGVGLEFGTAILVRRL